MRKQGAGDAPPQDQVNALIALQEQGRWQEILRAGSALSERHPQSSVVHFILGAANAGLGKFEPAVACFQKALEIKPDWAEAANNLGSVLQRLGRNDEAVSAYSSALELKPDFAQAHSNLGAALHDCGRHEEAISSYTRSLQINPQNATAYNNLGNTYVELERYDEAVEAFHNALKIDSGGAETHYNLANALRDLGRHEEAIAAYQRALAINPGHAEALNNMGIVLRDLERYEEAISCFSRSLEIQSHHPQTHYNLGFTLQEVGRRIEAIAAYTRVLEVKPDYAKAEAQKLHQLANICDWQALAADAAKIESLGVSGNYVQPFGMLSMEDHPARQRLRSERYEEQNYRQLSPLPPVPPPAEKPGRLRIGYFSADFHNHATMYLMARFFELHDGEQFSVCAYSYGPDKDDAMRDRIKAAAEVFRDVRSLSDRQVAELAREDGIDIAVDLKGYTGHSRPGIFAFRAAPIQISYLGYPGTTGAPYIDYIMADKTVIPEAGREHFTEKVIYLPHSYQVNDNTREISDRAMTRGEMGLPEQGFVFCCFNNNYKITAEEFDIWMRLLDRVEGSVLWLLRSNEWAEQNLKREAQNRGVEQDRLVFAEKLPLAEHLARHRLADLFLDTFNYNAHTTGSDALWAGLPLITRMGEGFAARVAASLLNAIGVAELITDTSSDYESLALELATDPEKLEKIKGKILANRDTAPLFDTQLLTRHVEEAYQQAYQRYFEGREPDVIEVQA